MKEEVFHVPYQDRLYEFTRVVTGKSKLRQKIYYKGVEILPSDGRTYRVSQKGEMLPIAITIAANAISRDPDRFL